METSPTTTSCRICSAPVRTPFALCFCCDTLARQLQLPLVPLVAIAEFEPGDALHRRLRGYKDAAVVEVRAAHTARLAAMLEAWLGTGAARRHLGPADEWDLVVTVPSSSRPAGDSVAAVVEAVPILAGRRRSVLRRGPAPTGHLRAARQGFVLRPDLASHGLFKTRVVLFDDSVVTGARAQSAAAALRLAGAQVLGVVALGRRSPFRPRART